MWPNEGLLTERMPCTGQCGTAAQLISTCIADNNSQLYTQTHTNIHTQLYGHTAYYKGQAGNNGLRNNNKCYMQHETQFNN